MENWTRLIGHSVAVSGLAAAGLPSLRGRIGRLRKAPFEIQQ